MFYTLISRFQVLVLVSVGISVPFSWSFESTTLNSHLFAVEESAQNPDHLEILAAESPRVLYLAAENSEALATAKVAIQMGSEVALEFDPNSFLISKLTLINEKPQDPKAPVKKWGPSSYAPSVLNNFIQLQNLFDSVDPYRDVDLSDHCFSRAHYWARTLEVDHQVKSMKVFVLFTPQYRNEHNFNWWYHVAPYVSVQTSGETQRIVIDPSYEQAPKEIRDWVFHFAAKADTCRIATSLAQYHAEAAQGGCVVITASMYHYTPQDLRPENPKDYWRCEDLRDVKDNLRSPAPYSDWKSYGSFLPDYCL